jgi:hypothetical protein
VGGAQAWTALRGWARVPRLLLWVFGLGLAYQIVAVTAFTFLADAIGFTLSFALAAVSAAVVIAVILLPISIGGFGVREGGFVVLLGKAGIGATDATLLSLLSVLAFVAASGATVALLALRSDKATNLRRRMLETPR